LAFIFVFDTSPVDGKRRPFLRGAGEGGIWWKRYCDFFPMLVVKTAPLPASATYVLGYHPHGIISVGAFGCFATHGAQTLDLTAGETEPRTDRRGFIALFPAIRLRLLTLSMNFWIPFAREYLLSLGVCDASRKSFRNILASGPGSGVLIVPGGAEESLVAKPGAISLVLAKRKGFVREAVLAGACVVPCLSFGENELYEVTEPKSGSLAAKVQRRIYELTGVGLPFFNGRSIFFKQFGLMPQRRPIVVVVGAPLAPPADARTLAPQSAEMREAVEKLHDEYVQALRQLYAAHKDAPWNLPRLRRSGTLQVIN
jgi:2-acylglycerol O-acyltransferase 2